MFKNKIKVVFMTILAAIMIGVSTYTIAPQLLPSITVHADSDATNLNDIWQTSSDNKPIVQSVDENNNIYYSITTNPQNHYYQIWQQAAQAWSDLNVVHLVQVPVGDSRSQITLSGTYHTKQYVKNHPDIKGLDTNVEGISNYDGAYWSSNTDYDIMSGTNSKLTPAIWRKPTDYVLATAEHELGHSLGFAHSTKKVNGKHVIMYGWTTANHAPLSTEYDLLYQHYQEELH